MNTQKLFRPLFLIMMLIVISAISSYAIETPVPPATRLQKVIMDGVKYPERAIKSCCTGSVDVTFQISEDGKIIIEKTYADNPEIDKMVQDQLAMISCKGLETPFNQRYKITITFKLLG
ncbi:MAG: hypothetical protein ACOYNC_09895 [Bacteroidales bacterium]